MAERIADPVRRLTRATRRIARGDFDARIAVRSSDELRRLVDAFNSMAAELKAQRDAARTDPPARGVGRDGAAGRARDQEPADADPAVGRAPAPRARRSRRADRAGARRMRRPRSSARCACCGRLRRSSPASRRRPTARLAPVDCRSSSPTSSIRTAPASPAGSRSTTEVAAPLPPVLVDRTLVARALANIVENALHAMPGSGRLLDARASTAASSSIRVARHRARHGRGGARARVRALLLDEDDRHRPRAADRQAQHRVQWRHDRRAERERRAARS